jgi:class 3 adenylate cyclase/tetratricopeptide (TPR) repeat protein
MQTVRQWLEQIGLPQYAEVFERNQIDLALANDLTDQDLRELGVQPLGHRKLLLRAIAELNGAKLTAATTQAIQDQPPPEQSLRVEAQRRQLTVMFCDLVGSTELATKLDPEPLRDLMQAYQRTCGEVIAQYEGHVAQYLGDGLMVYFGWPRAHEDDAVRAIRAGLEVAQAVSQLHASTPIRARVGIHTGLVVVGETGQGDASIPKAAVGETPNIAARLQGLAEPGSVVVSERTRGLAGGLFDYADLGTPALKGLSEPLRLFRVARSRTTDSRFEAARTDVALTPLVGREEEVALLLRRWREAKEGEGQVVLVGGEPGIGKSRLTRALRERLDPTSYTPLRYQCSPYHINSALYPVIEQFERAAGFTREDTPEQRLDKLQEALLGSRAQVAELAPLFAAMLSLPTDRYPALNVSPQKQKENTLEALAGQVEALAKRQPMLMIYEDAHWIDATSQEALDLLVPRLQRLPVLLLVTYRPEYTPKWAEQAHVTVLGLSRLGRRQGAELVAKLTGGRALPAQVLEQILAHTDGVPLFVEELTKSILESKLLREQADRYVLDGPLPALAIPTTLRDSLIARLDRLAPVREVAQIGACIGREFSYELLAAVSRVKGEKLDDALGQLTTGGLVFRRGAPPDATYTFKHALVQDAAYDSLLRSKRAELHARIARLLEQQFPDQVANAPELLAHHLTQAGDLSAAIPLWRKAGELALARVALQEAVGHFQQALALIERLPPSLEREGLELSIREPLTAAWIGLRGFAAPEVTANATSILQLAQKPGRSQSLLVGLIGIYTAANTQGRIAEALGWAQRALAEGENTGDIDLQLWGHYSAATSHFFLGHLLEARKHADQTLALWDPERVEHWIRLNPLEPKTTIGSWSSSWTWMLGHPDQAVQISEEKDAYARKLGYPFNLCHALTMGTEAFDFRCESERLLERVREADRIAQEQGLPFFNEVMVPVGEGLARLRSGQLPEAISALRKSMENWMSLGGRTRLPYMKSAVAEALALQGDFDAALHWIEEALEQIERPGWQERWHLAEILRLKGWILLHRGRNEEAEAQLHSSINYARDQQAKSWELRSSTTLAELLAERGQREAARALLSPVYSWFTEGFDTHDLKQAKGLLDELS